MHYLDCSFLRAGDNVPTSGSEGQGEAITLYPTCTEAQLGATAPDLWREIDKAIH